jgi:AraC-like DNA-binding protein
MLLDRDPAIESRAAIAISGATAMGATISGLLETLAPRAGEYGERDAAVVAASVADLLVAALDAGAAGDGTTRERGHLRRAMAYVQANLDRPSLQAADIAAAVGFSTRHLHRLFALEGTTPARYLLEQRLALCARELGHPQAAHRTVTQIAFAAGFTDAAHFSRAFRRRYGASPSAYRRRA